MAQAGTGAGAPAEVARAHHGSVSRQERAVIEEALKAGRLPAVVATSSTGRTVADSPTRWAGRAPFPVWPFSFWPLWF